VSKDSYIIEYMHNLAKKYKNLIKSYIGV